MTLLALDLGTKTGFCIGSELVHVSGSQDFTPTRFQGGGMRYLQFRRFLTDLHKRTPIHEIVFEEVHRHNGVIAAHAYGGFFAELGAFGEEHGIPYQGVGVAIIKKFATGKGNAPKSEKERLKKGLFRATSVEQAVRAWGYNPDSSDEFDAIALFHFWLSVSPPPTEAHSAVKLAA